MDYTFQTLALDRNSLFHPKDIIRVKPRFDPRNVEQNEAINIDIKRSQLNGLNKLRKERFEQTSSGLCQNYYANIPWKQSQYYGFYSP